MIRVKVELDTDDTNGLYGNHELWKDWVCEDFDENVVLLGRNGYNSIEEASWWETVKEVYDALDSTQGEDFDDFMEYYESYYYSDHGITEAKLRACWQMAENTSHIDDIGLMVEIAEILNPTLSFSYGEITGSMQGEYADVIYIDGSIDLQYLEDIYYGYLYNIDVYKVIPEDDENMEYEDLIGTTTITGTEYWRMTPREIEDLVRDCCPGIPADEEIEIED